MLKRLINQCVPLGCWLAANQDLRILKQSNNVTEKRSEALINTVLYMSKAGTLCRGNCSARDSWLRFCALWERVCKVLSLKCCFLFKRHMTYSVGVLVGQCWRQVNQTHLLMTLLLKLGILIGHRPSLGSCPLTCPVGQQEQIWGTLFSSF